MSYSGNNQRAADSQPPSTANRSRESEWAQNVMAFQRGLQDVSYSRVNNQQHATAPSQGSAAGPWSSHGSRGPYSDPNVYRTYVEPYIGRNMPLGHYGDVGGRDTYVNEAPIRRSEPRVSTNMPPNPRGTGGGLPFPQHNGDRSHPSAQSHGMQAFLSGRVDCLPYYISCGGTREQ